MLMICRSPPFAMSRTSVSIPTDVGSGRADLKAPPHLGPIRISWPPTSSRWECLPCMDRPRARPECVQLPGPMDHELEGNGVSVAEHCI